MKWNGWAPVPLIGLTVCACMWMNVESACARVRFRTVCLPHFAWMTLWKWWWGRWTETQNMYFKIALRTKTEEGWERTSSAPRYVTFSSSDLCLCETHRPFAKSRTSWTGQRNLLNLTAQLSNPSKPHNANYDLIIFFTVSKIKLHLLPLSFIFTIKAVASGGYYKCFSHQLFKMVQNKYK